MNELIYKRYVFDVEEMFVLAGQYKMKNLFLPQDFVLEEISEEKEVEVINNLMRKKYLFYKENTFYLDNALHDIFNSFVNAKKRVVLYSQSDNVKCFYILDEYIAVMEFVLYSINKVKVYELSVNDIYEFLLAEADLQPEAKDTYTSKVEFDVHIDIPEIEEDFFKEDELYQSFMNSFLDELDFRANLQETFDVIGVESVMEMYESSSVKKMQRAVIAHKFGEYCLVLLDENEKKMQPVNRETILELFE